MKDEGEIDFQFLQVSVKDLSDQTESDNIDFEKNHLELKNYYQKALQQIKQKLIQEIIYRGNIANQLTQQYNKMVKQFQQKIRKLKFQQQRLLSQLQSKKEDNQTLIQNYRNLVILYQTQKKQHKQKQDQFLKKENFVTETFQKLEQQLEKERQQKKQLYHRLLNSVTTQQIIQKIQSLQDKVVLLEKDKLILNQQKHQQFIEQNKLKEDNFKLAQKSKNLEHQIVKLKEQFKYPQQNEYLKLQIGQKDKLFNLLNQKYSYQKQSNINQKSQWTSQIERKRIENDNLKVEIQELNKKVEIEKKKSKQSQKIVEFYKQQIEENVDAVEKMREEKQIYISQVRLIKNKYTGFSGKLQDKIKELQVQMWVAQERIEELQLELKRAHHHIQELKKLNNVILLNCSEYFAKTLVDFQNKNFIQLSQEDYDKIKNDALKEFAMYKEKKINQRVLQRMDRNFQQQIQSKFLKEKEKEEQLIQDEQWIRIMHRIYNINFQK